MAQMPCIVNNGRVNNLIATQIIHGSVYNTLEHVACGRGTPSLIDEEQRKIDDELLASLAFERMFDRRSTIERAHSSTCRWIFHLREFKDWKSALRGLLWISGKPGSGKSTLMSFAYADLTASKQDQAGIYLDFFFNGRGNEFQRTPSGMFRALTNQIFVQNTPSRPLIREAFLGKRHAFGTSSAGWQWQEEELETLFFNTIMTTMQDVTTTIFIDALDEAGELNAQKLARFFHKLNDCATSTLQNVKICISCRHFPIVSRIKSSEIWVENHNNSDIAVFIHDRLDIDSLNNEDNYPEWQIIERELIKRAGGIFQWASLVVVMVERSILQGHSPGRVLRWLRDVPQQLGDVYKQILRDQIDDRFRPQTSLLFAMVCYAERRLCLSEIRFALAAWDVAVGNQILQCHETPDFIESDNIMNQRVKVLSGGLLEVLHNGVQIIHQSVHDFLTSGGFEYLFKLQDQAATEDTSTLMPACDLVPQERCHFMLHRCCLDYLAAIDSKLNLDFGFDRRQMLSCLPLVSYATTNLFVHAQYAQSVVYQDIDLYMSRLKLAFPRWKFAYRYLSNWVSQCPAPDGTLLHAASSYGLQYIAQYVITQGENLGQSDVYGRTPLQLAAQFGHLHLVQFLVHAGASIHNKDGICDMAVHLALGNGHSMIAKWLIEHNTGEFGAKEMMDIFPAVASAEDGELLRLVLRQSNVWPHKERSAIFQNVLRRAASQGRLSTVELLLAEVKKDIAGHKNLDQALATAAQFGQEKVVRSLIIAGADAEAQHGGGRSAFEEAAISGKSKIVQMLLPHVVEKRSRERTLGSALSCAASRGHEETVSLLLAAKEVVYTATTLEDAIEIATRSRAEHIRHRDYSSGVMAPRPIRYARDGSTAGDRYTRVLEMLQKAKRR